MSENALFLSAFNYTISLFSYEDDVFVNSIHSGRIDGRWARMAGCLFRTYFCRYTKVPHEHVDQFITRTGAQIMDTMKNYSSLSRMGDMFLQYQGDILDVPTPGDVPGERMHCIQLDSLPFHMQIMYDDDGFYTQLRYWENRFDRQLLELFLTCYEEVVRAMMEETSVRRLKRHLPENVFPKHFRIRGDSLNKAAGYKLLPYIEPRRWTKVYILDESYKKLPFGAWGPLYVMDHTPDKVLEVIENPYGPGTLYKTDKIARLLPNGKVDFLEITGRELCTDGAKGRKFIDLNLTRDALLALSGVKRAEVYMSFNPTVNEMSVYADVDADTSFDREAALVKLSEVLPEPNRPVDLRL